MNAKGIKRLADQAIGLRQAAILRKAQSLAYQALSPIDALARTITQRSDYPPLHLRRYVGPLRTFEMSGAEFLVYLKLLCGIRPEHSILDIGCGSGLVAIQLLDYVRRPGRYVGIDIHKPSIRWCQRHLTRRNDAFEFIAIDVANGQYNPKAPTRADQYALPFPNGSFDLVVVKSVFTHMKPEEVDNYFKEIARVMSAAGQCLATFFLLHDRQHELAAQGRNQLDFAYGNRIWRYVYRSSPESAIGYDRAYIMELMDKHGLMLRQPIYWGTWSGIADGLCFQDMAVICKKDGPISPGTRGTVFSGRPL